MRGPEESFCTSRGRAGGRGHFRGDAVNFAVMRPDAQLAGFQRVPVKNKTRFYHDAGNLVPLGPLSTIGVGRMRSIGHRVRPGLEISEGHDAAGYPMGCQIGRLTRHET